MYVFVCDFQKATLKLPSINCDRACADNYIHCTVRSREIIVWASNEQSVDARVKEQEYQWVILPRMQLLRWAKDVS